MKMPNVPWKKRCFAKQTATGTSRIAAASSAAAMSPAVLPVSTSNGTAPRVTSRSPAPATTAASIERRPSRAQYTSSR